MPQHDETTAKKHHYDWFKHRNKLSWHNRLNLETSMKITKIRISG